MGAKKCTTERFIEKAKEKHGNRYEYSKVVYTGVRDKVVITCNIHGDFEQTPESHLTPRGCFKCGRNAPQNRKPKKESYNFIKEAIDIHGDTYDYSLTNYTGALNNIEVICKVHGIFEQKAKDHIRGQGCKKCSTIKRYGTVEEKTKTFINKSIEKHGNIYDYSKTEVIKTTEPITIICKEHGEFSQTVNNHLSGQGCHICGRVVQGEKGRRFTTETFREELKNIHPNIDFSHTIYEGLSKKVEYRCNLHGSQSSFAGNLLKGHGCKECYNDRRKEEPGSWSYSSWGEKALISNYFDSFKVYIIKCWNDDEEFYKIGRTFVTIENRFLGKRAMPYNYELIKIFEEEDSKIVCQIEKDLKSKNKEFKYTPKIDFGGMYECFNRVVYD